MVGDHTRRVRVQVACPIGSPILSVASFSSRFQKSTQYLLCSPPKCDVLHLEASFRFSLFSLKRQIVQCLE